MSSLADFSEGDLEDAHHALDAFREWITNADTKAGLLSAASAVLVGAVGSQQRAITAVLSPRGSLEYIGLGLLIAWTLSLSVALAALGYALVPRIPHPSAPSRFAFPTVARSDWPLTPISRAGAAREAWAEAKVLALVAAHKFSGLRIAFPSFAAALALFLAWSAVAARIG
jgi:hypothetical protein